MSSFYRPSMNGIKHMDHTADLWLEAEGKGPDEMISRLIEGVYGVISSEFKVESQGRRKKMIFASTELETALIDLLNEVLFLFDAEEVVLTGRSIILKEEEEGVEILMECDISKASVTGGMAGMEVKAVTHHGANVKREEGRITGRVLLDI